MRIAHVFKDFHPPLAAGITRYIADVAEATAQRGYEVEVHVAGVRRSRRERLASGVIVHRHRELGRILSMPIAPGLMREVASLKVDLLHVHLPNPIGELAAALNGRGRVIASFHAQLGRQRFLEPLYAPVRNMVLGRADRILVSGQALKDSQELRRFKDKTYFLPYGVSPQLVGTRSVPESRARSLRLLFVGRLVYYKGVAVLLRALARVPGVELEVVGDGPDSDGLRDLAVEVGVDDRVRFLGRLPDEELRERYNFADVFVLPSVSRAEAFGMAMSEAMANGLPAISTSLGTGTDWVNLDGETGIVVPPDDVNALASAILRMDDEAFRQGCSRRAIARAETEFSFLRHVDSLVRVYEGQDL